MMTLDDFEKYARDNLPGSVFNHVSNGADDQQTLHDNRNAFKRSDVQHCKGPFRIVNSMLKIFEIVGGWVKRNN